MQYEWQYHVRSQQHFWTLRRNCVLSPSQLAIWFGSLSAVSLGIAAAFAVVGAWMVVPFALIEVSVLGLAFFCYARHAGDYERIEAGPGWLRVEASHGANLRVEEASPPWVRVDYRGRSRDPIVLVAGRQKIAVGRFVPDHRKPALVEELRGALSQG
jgi:uncharacterized membrane protein